MKKIRVGVFGAGRGVDIAKNFMLLPDCEIVALCDFNPDRLQGGAEALGAGVALYASFDEFIDSGLDAVILANYFHEHAPFAIRCFERGIHVFSECISNGTMAEGVELIRAFEKSSSVYFLAENYPQMKFNREMQRIAKSGTLGKILFAEGEYNHPGDPKDNEFRRRYNYFEKHWRNFLPRTYYITHSLGPVMKATGATPTVVSAHAIFAPYPKDVPSANRVGDRAAIVMTKNDDGSVFRITGCAAFGAHGNAYRICGTDGQIENLRGMGEKVMLRYNEWQIPEGAEAASCYDPEWNDKDEELIQSSGHGGSDYITARMFIECIKEGRQPEHPFDIHAAVAMSSVAILSHRSMLEGGRAYAIPDFHDEACRKQYENDRITPFWGTDGSAPNIPCCSVTDFAPAEQNLAAYHDSLK